MILSMSGQAWLFIATVVAGMVIGLFYDVFRILRKTAPHVAWMVQVEDAIFWIAATGAMFYFMLNQNFGEIRLFSIVGAACGLALYFATISRVVMVSAVGIINFIKRVIATVFRIITFPIRFLYGVISPHIQKLLKFAKIKMKKAARNWSILRKKV